MQHSLHSIPRHTFVLVQIRDGLSRRLMLLWNKWHAEKNKTRSVDKKSLFHIHLLQLKMQSVFMRAYIYIYIYICVCVSCFCVYVATKDYVYVWCKIHTILICCTYNQFINVEDNIFIVSGSIGPHSTTAVSVWSKRRCVIWPWSIQIFYHICTHVL